jgi:hypothetical protein
MLDFFKKFGYHTPWVTQSDSLNWYAIVGDIIFGISAVVVMTIICVTSFFTTLYFMGM